MLNYAITDQSTKLLHWYDRHHRVLPWRIGPAEQASGVKPDPYRVWLSEIMLQQTTVEAVKSYFTKFVERWPSVQAMAKASEDDILRAWAGLGYYSRARNLKKCADAVASQHNGRFPDNAIALKELPGIGDYTSAAIAAIAFGEAAAVVDGNVERVISRLYTIDTPLPAAKTEIRALMGQLTPSDRPGDFAQAMMDLGATICTPRRPACAICPLNDDCSALKLRDPEEFPVKAPKAEKPVRIGAAFVAIAGDGSILLRKRKGEGSRQPLDRAYRRRCNNRCGTVPGTMDRFRFNHACFYAFRTALVGLLLRECQQECIYGWMVVPSRRTFR
jgi:A/G-specific adenine glycosylase